jgi:hypothetical protein
MARTPQAGDAGVRTNAEADAINDAIQQRRVSQGELDPGVVAWRRGEQRILVGDTIQTRRNDCLKGVENRAQRSCAASAMTSSRLSRWTTVARWRRLRRVRA